LNQVRIRDVVADDPKMFEVHKLETQVECIKAGLHQSVIMRLACDSTYAKDRWVRAINAEVKQIHKLAKILSKPFEI
jgi:hypothetical protein